MSNVFAHADTVCSSPLLLALPWMATPPAVIELASCLATPPALVEFAGCPDLLSVDRSVTFVKKRGGSELFMKVWG